MIKWDVEIVSSKKLNDKIVIVKISYFVSMEINYDRHMQRFKT